ncbi:hypothetical protein EBH_0057110 [Eimeria brunetti]|uniref:Uncharacterized protein n=1 Tax=Eimeria brunetti TaxID=51314 RepID=U6LTK3_9EIME|nr:hypothetical protein EBH_0057110 [Eimeria brunetti]
MLRIKRSQVHHNVAELTAAAAAKPLPEDPVKEAASQLQQEEREKQQLLQQEELLQQQLQQQLRFQQQQQTEQEERLIAEAEFELIQKKRKQKQISLALDPNSPAFVSSRTFIGPRLGYAFKIGPQGLGYYLDEEQVGPDFLQQQQQQRQQQQQQQAASTSSSSGSSSSSSSRQQEEMDIDVDEVTVEERGVPDSVFGSLKKANNK